MHNEQSVEEPKRGAAEGNQETPERDFVYPPPPSYYQNMPESSVRLPLPPTARPLANAPNQGPSDLSGYSVSRQASPVGIPAGRPTSAFPSVPVPSSVRESPAKGSARWTLILIAVVGSVLLLSCGLCGWAFASTFNVTYERVTNASSAVDGFYQGVQKRDYAAAYAYLTPTELSGRLTLSNFVLQLHQREASYGSIGSYTLQQPSFTGDPTVGLDFSRLLIPVTVTRGRLTYTATLTLSKVNGTWKIVGFDQI